LKRLLLIGSAVLGLLVLVAAYAAHQLNTFLHMPVTAAESGVDFVIEPGTSFRAVADDLAALGVIDDARTLRLYARWTGKANAVQAGDYLISAGTTPADLLEQFTSGDVKLYSFTIIEGWNQYELLEALRGDSHIEATLTDEDWPREAHNLMQQVLAEEWAARSAETPVATPYEALILASIIEKETARVDERQRISGVFTRRLNKRMRLQTDPTVIYGIGPEFNGNLTRRDLRTDTPYNTYTRGGLPPTPIAMPGRAAIHAALHPAEGEELYFVATGLGDGSHAFSTTKEEHDAAVAEYLRRLRQQRNR
jgi:UPF0755 protein